MNEDTNIPFVGQENQEEILHLIREGEEWLEGDGDNAKYADYLDKYSTLNAKYT